MQYTFIEAISLQILFRLLTYGVAAPQGDASSNTTITSGLIHPMETVLRQYFDERKNAPARGTFGSGYKFDMNTCTLPAAIKKQIAGQKDNVNQILDAILRGKFKNKAWEELALFVDLFAQRTPGSDAIERAMSFLGERMQDDGLTNLKEEEIKIPIWQRGLEAAILTNPVELELNVRGLALSVETPAEGITADVIVLRDFREAEEFQDIVKGKIVVFNSDDGDADKHMLLGPIVAAQYGAVGVLVRSPAKLVSSYTVLYDDDIPKIPAAVISQDDADKLSRLASREDDVSMHFRLINTVHTERLARNLFGDYPGQQNDGGLDKEIVMVMSHGASWDVGEGAHDDGVGIIINSMMISVFKYLEIRPKRTIRNAIFTADESGLGEGISTWVENHKSDLQRINAVLEADMGCVKASGFVFSGDHDGACIVGEIMKLFEEDTGANLLAEMEAIPSNVMHIHAADVPTLSLIGDDVNSEFFEIQHTFRDSMTGIDPDELDNCLAVMASTAFVLADMEERLPRAEDEES